MHKHPRTVIGYNESLENLAKAIGDMTYDQVAELIGLLADDLKKQSESDFKRNRFKLSKSVLNATDKLYAAKQDILLAWKICEPFMKNKD
jgi:hypothetical protein